MRKFLAAALLALGALSAGSANAAVAVLLDECNSGCLTDDGIITNVNYTVPSDGRTYRWDLWTDDPTVSITLPHPNEDFAVLRTSNGDGTFSESLPAAPWSWQETITPGHTTIFTHSLFSDFNFCSGATPAGVLCQGSYNVWGNDVLLTVDTHENVLVYFSSTVVPEPATWGLMLTGFLAVGSMARRRRLARGPNC